ncbi:protein yellow [Sergentomyia squamirostris]
MHNILIIILLSGIALVNGVSKLKPVADWKDLEYEFPTQTDRQNAIIQKKYVQGNGVPIDVDISYRNNGGSLIFVTVPRFTTGIPITLGTITGMSTSNGPIIRAYPDYPSQSSHGMRCDGTSITSVFRVFVDRCKRLWVLDTGKIGEVQYCQPQLLLFDLTCDRLIRTYRIPMSQFKMPTSLFVTPMVDIGATCDDAMVYMADVTSFGLVVYDLRRNRSWRVQNKLAYPHPKYGTFTIKGDSFDLMDGILGLAISPKMTRNQRGGYGLFYPSYPYENQNSVLPPTDRFLFFHALASATENAVPLSILNNASIWENDPDAQPRSFVEIGFRGTQSAAQAMDQHGNLFFGLMDPIAIACWDTSTMYDKRNIKIVAQDDPTLQFASGLKIVMNGYGEEELWVLTNSFQRSAAGTKKFTEVNYRIMARKVSELLGGTRCAGGDTSGFTFPTF